MKMLWIIKHKSHKISTGGMPWKNHEISHLNDHQCLHIEIYTYTDKKMKSSCMYNHYSYSYSYCIKWQNGFIVPELIYVASVCGIVEIIIIHIINVKPYNKEILNKLDGII